MVPGNEIARGHLDPDVSHQLPPRSLSTHYFCHLPSLVSSPAPQGPGTVPSSKKPNVSMATDK